MDGLHKLDIFMQVNNEWSYNEGNITSTCTRMIKVWIEYYYYYYFISLEPFLTKLVIYSFHCNFQYQSFTFFTTACKILFDLKMVPEIGSRFRSISLCILFCRHSSNLVHKILLDSPANKNGLITLIVCITQLIKQRTSKQKKVCKLHVLKSSEKTSCVGSKSILGIFTTSPTFWYNILLRKVNLQNLQISIIRKCS